MAFDADRAADEITDALEQLNDQLTYAFGNFDKVTQSIDPMELEGTLTDALTTTQFLTIFAQSLHRQIILRRRAGEIDK